jgi:hypothetical protein
MGGGRVQVGRLRSATQSKLSGGISFRTKQDALQRAGRVGRFGISGKYREASSAQGRTASSTPSKCLSPRAARLHRTGARLFNHGLTVGMLADLVWSGLATGRRETVRVGYRKIKVVSGLTDAGPRALKVDRAQIYRRIHSLDERPCGPGTSPLRPALACMRLTGKARHAAPALSMPRSSAGPISRLRPSAELIRPT